MNILFSHKLGQALLLVTLGTYSTLTLSNLISFRDTPLGNSACDVSGSSSDRSCGSDYKILNGTADSKAGFEIKAHVAADAGSGGVFSNVKSATAELTFQKLFQYDVTRTVIIEKRGNELYQLIPKQSLKFDISYDFRISVKDESGGGEEQASFFTSNIKVTPSSSSIIPEKTVTLDSFGEVFDSAEISGQIEKEYLIDPGSSIGEISTLVELPTNFELWDDLEDPFAGYQSGDEFEQKFTDYVGVNLFLKARSEGQRNVIGQFNGGEAFVCGGQGANIGTFTGPFTLDNFNIGTVFTDACALEVGYSNNYPLADLIDLSELPPYPNDIFDPTGFFAKVEVVQTGWEERLFSPTASEPLSVSEPSVITMMALGLAGLGFARRHRKPKFSDPV
jgi:hypothetical protein